MRLYDVELEEFMFPCFTYCMKRTGLNMDWTEFRQQKEQPVPDTALIPTGAILRWDCDNGENRWVQSFLTIKGQRVISTWHNINVHYGVYEGDGIVSDLVVGDDKDPYIRLRELDKLYQRPRGMIIYERVKVNPGLSEQDYRVLQKAQDKIDSMWRQEEMLRRERCTNGNTVQDDSMSWVKPSEPLRS